MRSLRLLASALLLPLLAASGAGCASGESSQEVDDGALTSEVADFYDLGFESEVIAPASVLPRQAIVTQLYYTEGRLTHLGGNSRPGFVKLTNVESHPVEGAEGTVRITYKAQLPILWAKTRERPTDYKVAFPKKVDQASLDAFNAKYDGRCGRNEYGVATFWHDFDNGVEGCRLEDDAIEVTATVRASRGVVADKYPEYDRIYSDGLFRAVSVFGLDGWSDEPSDKGVQVFERFQQDLKGLIPNAEEQTRPRNDFVLREVTIKGELHGKKIEHTMLLVSQMEHANESFDRRFNEVTENADLVTYDGHSGLGKNIAAITARGTVKRGQYQIWFLDGCNSLGYVDSKFTERRREANGSSDRNGTKHVDLIGNGLPSYYPWGETTTFKVVRDLANSDAPKSYQTIIEEFPAVQVAAVIGDEDNTFTPSR